MLRALILGIGGQDGSYLAEILLEKGYEVHGLYRRSSCDNLVRIRHILDKITLHQGDLLDRSSIVEAIKESQPHEIYNEADQDDVRWSYSMPLYSYQVTFGAVGSLLDVVALHSPDSRVFLPVSATIFGAAPPPQNEESALDPHSPYACSKAGVLHLARYFRRNGMFVSTAILFNHDSPRRSEEYLVHKICRSALRIAAKEQDYLDLYNVDDVVDVGHAREFMDAAWRIMQLEKPADLVIATGKGVPIRELAYTALACVEEPADRIRTTTRPGVQQTLIGDIRRAQSLIDFKPSTPTQTVKTIIEELRCE